MIPLSSKVFLSSPFSYISLIISHPPTNSCFIYNWGIVGQSLKILEVNFKGINVLENQNLREGIKTYSDWPTIPQLYIKQEFVGGCDIVKEMFENGELSKILESKNISFKKKS